MKKVAKLDRTRYVDLMVANGNWEQIRKLRKPTKPKQGRLKNSRGELVDSDHWANTRAKHLEEVQWRVRPVSVVDGLAIGNELPVSMASFTEAEVHKVVKKFRSKKAAGPDDMPQEYFKAIAVPRPIPCAVEKQKWLPLFPNLI